MKKVNFFAQEHRKEPVKQDELLGICDPEGESPAYTTTEHGDDKWCAVIENKQRKMFQFIAIDKNIEILRSDGNLENRCDGMIYVAASRELCFVELKDDRVGYISNAKSQLLKTLKCFLTNVFITVHFYELLFLCNLCCTQGQTLGRI